jgi:CheY-like chemotaxis protein/DNA-binding transcriptional MerR regulator
MEESQRPVLAIGVVADILGVSVQTLRLWENKGLVSPSRIGKDRYYSEEELKRLKYIKYLLHEKKLNTYGVRELLLKEGWKLDIPAEEKPAVEMHSHPVTDVHPSEERPAGRSILVIDDDPDHINILKTVLESNAYNVITAMRGRDGLEKATTEKPGMIILDVMIPDMDGMEICRRLKSDPVTSTIPVLVISSIPENLRSRFGVNSLPADGFAQKPVRPADILEEVRRFLG